MQYLCDSSSLDVRELSQNFHSLDEKLNYPELRGQIACSQKIDAVFYKDLYEKADSFLDGMDVHIVDPEPCRKPLILSQCSLEEASKAQTAGLSADTNIYKIIRKDDTLSVFDLKSIKESPLILRRKLLLASSMRVPNVC